MNFWLVAVAVGVGLVLPFVVLLIQQFTELGDRTIPCCDYAVLDMGTRAFLRGEQLVGLYSREGWRHPGPAPFVWSAPFSVLPFRGFARFQIGVVVLHMAALGFLVAGIVRRVRPPLVMVTVSVLAFFVWRFDINQFREPWNPYMAMSLVMLAVVAAARVLTENPGRWLVVYVVAASMAAQTHMGAVPVIGATLVIIIVAVVRRRVNIEARRLNVAIGVAGVMWLLPVIDLFIGDHNAISIFRHSGDGPAMSLRAIGRALVWMFSLSPGELGRFFGTSSAFDDGGSPSVANWIVAAISLVGAAFVISRRFTNPFPALLVGISMLGISLTTISMLVADGPFIRYLMLPVLGLSLLIWIVIAITVIDLLGAWTTFVLAPVAVTLGVISSFSVSDEVLAREYSNALIDNVVEGIRVNCDRLPDQAVVDVSDSVSWADAVSMVDQIDRCTPTRVTNAVGFISGQSFPADPDDKVNVRIAPASELSDVEGIDIATWDDVVVRVTG